VIRRPQKLREPKINSRSSGGEAADAGADVIVNTFIPTVRYLYSGGGVADAEATEPLPLLALKE
jgi:hypothetical protein